MGDVRGTSGTGLLDQDVTNSNTITISVASLANGSSVAASAIDNSSTKYNAANVQCKLKTGASGVSGNGLVNVYLIRSCDGGTTYDDTTAVWLGSMAMTANATTYVKTFSTSGVGELGSHWKVGVENKTGAALDSTAGNHLVQYSGFRTESA